MDYCVRTKDNLLQLLNDCSTLDDLFGVCNNAIFPLLIHGEGLWMDCRYCYKAVEIANRAIIQCDHWLGTCLHHSKIKRLQSTKQQLMKLQSRYLELHDNLRNGQD